MLISIIFWVLAAICNAIMDTFDFHFSSSIFSKLDESKLNPQVSWIFTKRILGYPLDGWHIMKSLMIFLIIGAFYFRGSYPFYLTVLIYGGLWIVVFNLFFKILNVKKW